MSTIPTIEPTAVTAGDTVQWTRTWSDYPASAGWVLSYTFIGPATLTITATASGDDHAVAVTAAHSALWAAGSYIGQAYLTNGSERHTVEPRLLLEVSANFAAAADGYDPRTANEIALAAIDAVLANCATSDQRKVVIGDKQIERFERNQLLSLRGVYANRVWRERNPGLLAPSISMEFAQ